MPSGKKAETRDRLPYLWPTFLLAFLATVSLGGGIFFSHRLSKSEGEKYALDLAGETDPRKLYNSGIRLQASEEENEAEAHYLKALSRSEGDEGVALKSLFNLGVLYARKAESQAEENPDEKLRWLVKSMEAYRAMLVHREEMEPELLQDARHNFEKARRRHSEALELKKLNEKESLLQKPPYALLEEIEQSEGRIPDLIERLEKETDLEKRAAIQEQIIGVKEKNFARLRQLYLSLGLEIEENDLGSGGYSI